MNNHTLLSDLGDFPTKGIRQHHKPQYNIYQKYDDTHDTYRNNNEQEFLTPQYRKPDVISCREIANHVDDCPICKKFYDSDSNMYIIIIIILLLINIYLLRKIK